MIQSAGVLAQTNEAGEIVQVTIDVQKHRELAEPALQYLKAEEKSKFMQEFEQGLTLEEARKSSHEYIKKIWKK